MKLLESAELTDLDSTARFAEKIQSDLSGTVSLSGGLGSGKTTLCAMIVKLFGGPEVSSPTFVIGHEYETTSGELIEHWDLYRLAAPPAELFEPCPEDTLRLVEWGDKFPAVIAISDFLIKIELHNIIEEIITRRIEFYAL